MRLPPSHNSSETLGCCKAGLPVDAEGDFYTFLKSGDEEFAGLQCVGTRDEIRIGDLVRYVKTKLT